MIVVIADDFTGAAELGGIGLRYGLSVEIQTETNPDCSAELLIIDTNTRSASEEKAAKRLAEVVRHFARFKAEWVYKKTDSVLRGHVLTELEALLAGLKKQRVLLVPANPAAGRVISGGQYFINGTPLHKTDFIKDPEYPRTSSHVLELLGESQLVTVRVSKYTDLLLAGDIIIGEVESETDLKAWASQLNEHWLPAGGADFFSAILEVSGFLRQVVASPDDLFKDKTAFFVLGSSAENSRRVVDQLMERGFPVCEMPGSLQDAAFSADECIQQWTMNILKSFEKYQRVMAAIHQPVVHGATVATKLAVLTARVVDHVLQQVSVDEIVIEGGATASTVLHRLGWKRMSPTQEIAPGVVRMRVMEKPWHLTVKPGSYPWPENIW